MAALLLALLLCAPLHAGAQTCHLTITVDGDDEPVPEARVMLFNRQGRVVATGLTDGEGRLALEVAPGNYLVRASAPGLVGMSGAYSRAEVQSIEGDVAVRLRLWPSLVPDPADAAVPGARSSDGEIRGRVRTTTGLPVEDAVVEATGYAGGTQGRTLTARDGSYRLRVSPGTYSVSARKGSPVPPPSPGVVPREWHHYPAALLEPHVRVVAEGITRARDLVLVHVRTVRMTVTVRDESGAVVPAAAVHYVARRAGTSMAGHFDTRADGTVALGPFSPGEVRLHARARAGTPGALAGVLRVTVGDEPLDDVTMVLPAGATVRGRVEFEGRPGLLHGPSGLRVLDTLPGHGFGWQSGDPRGVVEQDGSFELDGLVDGQCLAIEGIPAGWSLAAIDLFGDDYLRRPLRLTPGETVSGLVIRVAAGAPPTDDRGPCAPGRSDPP